MNIEKLKKLAEKLGTKPKLYLGWHILFTEEQLNNFYESLIEENIIEELASEIDEFYSES